MLNVIKISLTGENNMNLRAALATASLVFASTLIATTYSPEVLAQGVKGNWRVPLKKARKQNPIPLTTSSIVQGHEEYVRACVQCHGKNGGGNESFDHEFRFGIPDLSQPNVWLQTDGALFWKIRTGRSEMPGFKHEMTKQDIWHVINYMRSDFNQ
jgi:mono/diheme cytochrome c family protein